MHRRDLVPGFVDGIENFDRGESLGAVVSSDGVEFSPHHRHADSAPQHAHRLGLVPATGDRVESLHRAQRISCKDGSNLRF